MSKSANRLLVVDDDPGARDWLALFASRLGYDVQIVGSGEEALAAVQKQAPHVITLDVMLPGMDGIATLKALKQTTPSVPVIMLSGHGQTHTIVEAVRNGAANFMRKPFEAEELELALTRALDSARSHASAGPDSPPERSWVMGQTAKIRHVLDVIEHVADTDITVLIRGESGTGKEIFAHQICQQSCRATKPFVKVNCAALPSELLESELFGYERGAFTGAERRKLGKFEIANHGTIFLDEISEMHPSLQAKLLQVLQDGQFSRLGGSGDVCVDARVIAATNRDLEESVREGRFREDLFYRLNVVTLQVPPLRERRDEIPPLTEFFLKRYSREYGKDYRPPSAQLLASFLEYAWPGNVRELENLTKRLVVLAAEEPVLQEVRERGARQLARVPSSTARTELQRFINGEIDRVSLKRIARDAAQAAERRIIEKVLQQTRWNRKEAAQILQVSYKALLYKMRDAGLVDRA